ncbi:MAG: tetraacyldisaccharide 4'-kinase [Magnetococcales bacterium]|nr:tetraacyldisaccharide 4'-kinase [Magnetococcales bacterium]
MNRLLPFLDGRTKAHGWLVRSGMAVLGGMGRGYGWIQAQRSSAYQKGILSSWKADCPVIAVGNLTAGGTGKTPMTAWLGRYFLGRGIPLAIVSRGYRQQSRAAITVVADGQGHYLSAPEAADEAVLLAHALPGARILTGTDRRRLIQHAFQHLECRLILMDDAYQHLQVKRDFNLLLLDAHHPLGNGRLLPGGLLREMPQAMARADAVIVTRAGDKHDIDATTAIIRRYAPGVPMAYCRHQPRYWIRAGDNSIWPLNSLAGEKALAFCGIGNPESFRSTLADVSVSPVFFQAFPDHYPIDISEIRHLEGLARTHGASVLLTTQKDYVKIPPGLTHLPIYALVIDIHFLQIPSWLTQRLEEIAAMVIQPSGR